MAPASSSSSDSDSSRSTSPEPENTQKKAIKAATKTKDEVEDDSSDSSDSSDSDSGSDSGSDSDSESGSSSEMDTSEDATEEQLPAKKVHIPGPNQPYKPPFGFKSAKKQSPPSSSTSSVLSNLRGKQVFHITAPSFLPLSKVKEITMSKVVKGEPIMTYDGKNYGIPADSITDTDPEGKTLLVYDETTQTYCNKADHIQSFHIQEFAGLPEEAVQSTATAIQTLRDTVKPPRSQPKGMKMRFRPVGSLPSEPETLGLSSESESEEPRSTVPVGEKEKERKRKHSHTDGDASQASAEPRKKSKKHTQDNDDDAERSQKKSKKSHKDREEKKRKRSEKA